MNATETDVKAGTIVVFSDGEEPDLFSLPVYDSENERWERSKGWAYVRSGGGRDHEELFRVHREENQTREILKQVNAARLNNNLPALTDQELKQITATVSNFRDWDWPWLQGDLRVLLSSWDETINWLRSYATSTPTVGPRIQLMKRTD